VRPCIFWRLQKGECTSDKLPAMPFFIGDWKKDPAIGLLNLAERGLWLEILFLMWESEERGRLMVNGLPLGPEELAKILGQNLPEVCQAFARLESLKVFGRDEAGVVVSRRLLRQKQISSIRMKAGKKGAKARYSKKNFQDDGDDILPLQNNSKPLANTMAKTWQNNVNETATANENETEIVDESAVKEKGDDGGNGKLTDEQFIEAFKTNPAYRHFDVGVELGKMDSWLLAHPGRQKTRRFVVNWLNKIDKPMEVKGGKNDFERRTAGVREWLARETKT